MPNSTASPAALRVRSLSKTICEHPVEMLIAERHLMATKWFDYRFLSPKAANKLFQRIFAEVYKRKFRESIDASMAKYAKGVSTSTLEKDARERTHLVMARQRADASGMPYPVYIVACFDFALRNGNNRKKLPRPNQLHGNEDSAPYLATFLANSWNEYIADGLWRVENPAYVIDNYCGLQAQDDYRNFVLDYVRRESILFHRAILSFTYERRQVPLEVFEKEFGPEHFKRAMESVEYDLRHHPIETRLAHKAALDQLWPTCFGMHYTQDLSSPECRACPQKLDCKKIGDRVLKDAQGATDKADPAGDYKKKLARDRQRQCRERKRVAEAGSEQMPVMQGA